MFIIGKIMSLLSEARKRLPLKKHTLIILKYISSWKGLENSMLWAYYHVLIRSKLSKVLTVMVKQGRKSLNMVVSVFAFDFNSILLDKQLNKFSVYMFFCLDHILVQNKLYYKAAISFLNLVNEGK